MPIKLFQDGEILDASEVNTYFMDQALIVFDDSAQRDAAFGGSGEPVLQEGRICYLKSDNTIYIYTGAAWTAQLATIADSAITTAKLDGTSGSEAVTTAKIRDGAVTEAKIGSSAVTEGKIASGAVTEAKIGSGAVTEGKIASGAVTSAKIADGTIVNADINASAAIAYSKLNLSDSIVAGDIADSTVTLSKLASALQAFLVPVGTIAMYGGSSAPTGWLLCNGTSTTGYPTLAGIVGSTTPDLRGRFAIGDNASLTLLATGGSATIAEANLPSHTHTFSTTSGGQSQSHNHTVTLSESPHNHGQNQHDHAGQATRTFTTSGHTHDNGDYFMAGVNGAGVYTGGGVSIDPTTATNIEASTGITVSSVGNASQDHTHTVSGTTAGGSGSGTAYYPPHLVVNYIIKHD